MLTTSQMIYHCGGEPEREIHRWFNVMAHKSWITAEFVTVCCPMSVITKLCAAFSLVKEATKVTHLLGLNFTLKLWAESLALMSVDYAWALPEAACPCLSWSAVAMHAFNMSRLCSGLPLRWHCASRSIGVELDSEGSIVSTWTGTWILTSLRRVQTWKVRVPSYSSSLN